MKQYHLYIFETPEVLRLALNHCATKVGIAKSLNSRNGDYQQAYGPVLEMQFTATWQGPEDEIRWLEGAVLKSFDHKVCASVRALSEWVDHARASEVIERVEQFIKERSLSIKRVD